MSGVRRPKIDALHRLIDWFNSRLADEFKITKLDLDSSSIDANPWLAGLLEADGNFYCSYNLSSEGYTSLLKSYMRIPQRLTQYNWLYFFQFLLHF